jgi:hypothetical protein
VHHERNVLEEDQGCIDANISKLAPCISKDVQYTPTLQNTKRYIFINEKHLKIQMKVERKHPCLAY